MLTQLAITAPSRRPRRTNLVTAAASIFSLNWAAAKAGASATIRGKENMLSLGTFPSVTLAQARARRDEAKRTIAEGKDPVQKRREEKLAAAVAASNTFGVIAEEYIAKLKEEGAAESTLDKNAWLLLDLAAPLRNRPIAELAPAEILDLLKRIEKSGRRDTARRLRGVIGSVCRYAVVTLRGQNDPTFALRKPEPRERVAGDSLDVRIRSSRDGPDLYGEHAAADPQPRPPPYEGQEDVDLLVVTK